VGYYNRRPLLIYSLRRGVRKVVAEKEAQRKMWAEEIDTLNAKIHYLLADVENIKLEMANRA
jgi:hypothetical protein